MRNVTRRPMYVLGGFLYLVSLMAISAQSFSMPVNADPQSPVYRDPTTTFGSPQNEPGFPADSQKIFNFHSQTFTVDSQGDLYGIGSNNCGILGDPNLIGQSVDSAVQIQGIDDVTMVAEANSDINGGETIFALKSDGTVWSWGCDNGFLARTTNDDPTGTYDSYPGQITSLSNIIKISAGTDFESDHILALDNQGAIYAWGEDPCGELGFNSDSGLCHGPIKLNTLSA